MNIILEGNECNFKTTVAKKVSKLLGYEVKKGSSFEMSTGTNDNLYQSFKDMLDWENKIVDRFIYSNRVYATLYPKYTILTDEQYAELQWEFKDKAILIYLHASEEVLVERITTRGDEYVESGMLGAINKEYDKIIPGAMLSTFSINTENNTSDDIAEFIADLVKGEVKWT